MPNVVVLEAEAKRINLGHHPTGYVMKLTTFKDQAA